MPNTWKEWHSLSMKKKAKAILNARYEAALESGYELAFTIDGHKVYVADWDEDGRRATLETCTLSEFVNTNDYWVTDYLEEDMKHA